ncbi:PadR family transcriptional regulator [Streptomyces mangrovisoli]|uniref:PadR family transcriptional regulator n=1 Tax=Streptomyces mangrovisoli TaxID=1428628 RepID=A0A1J4NVK6_9ACTN|nr:PadR family transcriptional regulator [Streptomyces mangrovisoli]OIJ66495.1 PadR family transcriptional regulator [Streptomyces mangrovisoli]
MTNRDGRQPMREPTLLLMAALADAPRHGYALIAEVEQMSQGRVRLRAGTLYGALDRLLAEGLVRVEREEVVDGRARRVYALTEPGTAALDAEVGRMEAVAREARRRLGRLSGGAQGVTG